VTPTLYDDISRKCYFEAGDVLILCIFEQVADIYTRADLPSTWRRRVGKRSCFRDAYLRPLSHTESIERICPVMPSILHNTFPYPATSSSRFPPRRRRPRSTVADIRGRIAFDVRHRFHIRCVEYSFPRKRNVGCSPIGCLRYPRRRIVICFSYLCETGDCNSAVIATSCLQ